MIIEITRGYPPPIKRRAVLPQGVTEDGWYVTSDAYCRRDSHVCVAQLTGPVEHRGKWVVWTGGYNNRQTWLTDTDEEATSLIVADILKGE